MTIIDSLNSRFSPREEADNGTGSGSIRLTFASIQSDHISFGDTQECSELYVFKHQFPSSSLNVSLGILSRDMNLKTQGVIVAPLEERVTV